MNSPCDIPCHSSAGHRCRVILRADAGGSIGYGHFVRTVALAAYLKDDFDVEVVSRNPELGQVSEFQRNLTSKYNIPILDLKGSDRERFDRDFLKILSPDDIVVLDNYYYPTEYQTAVRNTARALVCIDDMHDRHFVADLLMTFCPLSADDFSMEPYTRFRGGIEWSFLREEFLKPASSGRERKVSDEPTIVMAMGGADPFRLTDKMIRIVRKLRPSCTLHVIAGETVRLEAEGYDRMHVWRNVEAATIAGLFDASDLGIFPASTVCVEAFSRRLPMAAGYYVDNQEEFYARGVEEGWFAPLGSLLDDETQIEARLGAILDGKLPEAPEFDFPARKEEIIDLFRTL